jgi:outer membrane protein OmpA-like peptidoglycan-associated protein
MGFRLALLSLAASALVTQQPLPAPLATQSRLTQSSRVDDTLEVKSASADGEAIMAGLSYTTHSYAAPQVSPGAFVSIYRDALVVNGWKLLEVPKLGEGIAPPEGVIDISAQYMADGRNIYVRISRAPDGTYEIKAADVGAEDWPSTLAKDCRLVVPSLHFHLDRPTLREFESQPTLRKLADVLKSKSMPAVEIQGHMDNVGEAGVAARQTLSEGRARAVAAWLIAHGVPASKIAAKGYGKTKPIAENDSDLGRARNRRIEIATVTCNVRRN